MELYRLATIWDDLTNNQRAPLKKLIRELTGYDCLVACNTADNLVYLYVMSAETREVTDWLEIQPSGAIGVTFDAYEDPDNPRVESLSDACDAYNEEHELEFIEDSTDEHSTTGESGESEESSES